MLILCRPAGADVNNGEYAILYAVFSACYVCSLPEATSTLQIKGIGSPLLLSTGANDGATDKNLFHECREYLIGAFIFRLYYTN